MLTVWPTLKCGQLSSVAFSGLHQLSSPGLHTLLKNVAASKTHSFMQIQIVIEWYCLNVGAQPVGIHLATWERGGRTLEGSF